MGQLDSLVPACKVHRGPKDLLDSQVGHEEMWGLVGLWGPVGLEEYLDSLVPAFKVHRGPKDLLGGQVDQVFMVHKEKLDSQVDQEDTWDHTVGHED